MSASEHRFHPGDVVVGLDGYPGVLGVVQSVHFGHPFGDDRFPVEVWLDVVTDEGEIDQITADRATYVGHLDDEHAADFCARKLYSEDPE
jgi:hypothetical protein